MGSHTLEVINSLKEAIKMKKKEFRNQRGKAYLSEDDEEEEDDIPVTTREEEKEADDEDHAQDDGFKRDRQEFMRRKRTKNEGPSIALFDKKSQGGNQKPMRPNDPKARPGQGKG